MVSSSKKYCKSFIVQKDDTHKIEPVRIILPKTSSYIKCYDGETKQMYFFNENGKLLETYNDIWNKVSNSIKKTWQ